MTGAIELSGEWVNYGDLDYVSEGGLFIQLTDELGEPGANVIEVYGWNNLENPSPRVNLMTLYAVTLQPGDWDLARRDVGAGEWASFTPTQRAYRAVQASVAYRGQDATERAEIETPFTKGVAHYLKTWKERFA